MLCAAAVVEGIMILNQLNYSRVVRMEGRGYVFVCVCVRVCVCACPCVCINTHDIRRYFTAAY